MTGFEYSANIARWGLLQLYESVDENKNAAQINDMLTQLMAKSLIITEVHITIRRIFGRRN
ncbi:hypothetical protein PACILC2_43730 [Paenibacillus cisolokensis]|uniref:YqbQ/XkdQ domain-containing protein n=1 Tax=Paenibacillus cisolokensis TaxID=1658519 RepID=A0ABQ4NC46_9BACL|nr:hypothetical protein PACILC2_43730 [Paenibacillus cisolokensis]